MTREYASRRAAVSATGPHEAPHSGQVYLVRLTPSSPVRTVDAEMFEFLFAPMAALPVARGPVLAEVTEFSPVIHGAVEGRREDVAEEDRPNPTGEAVDSPKRRNGKREAPVQECVLSILREHGPLTGPELRDHLIRARGTSQAATYVAISTMKQSGQIERRECPQTRLDKWFIKNNRG